MIYIVNGKYYAESSNIIKSFHQVYVNKFNESSFFHLLFEQKVSFVQNMVDNSLDYSDSLKTIKKIYVTSQISQVRSGLVDMIMDGLLINVILLILLHKVIIIYAGQQQQLLL